MNILITGADGFIGKNLSYFLKEKNHNIIKFSVKNKISELEGLVHDSDLIIHLAGRNNIEKAHKLNDHNVYLTNLICEILIKKKLKIPLIFTSLKEILLNKNNGKTKLKDENLFHKLYLANGNPIVGYKLPEVFGKWSTPNENLVVATLCNNIARNEKITTFESKNIELIYIDDLASSIIKTIKNIKKNFVFIKVEPVYKVSINDIKNYIIGFKYNRNNLIIDDLGHGLIKKLYSTYITFLPENEFSYHLKKHTDNRGEFVEVLKNFKIGQFSYFTSKSNITRGDHYHHSKCEKFLVLQGKAKFKFKNLISKKIFEIIVSSDKPEIVETIPGWSHNIKNIGEKDLIVMLWSNEVFDPENPDTNSYKV